MFSFVLYRTVLYYTVLYCTILYYIYCTVLYFLNFCPLALDLGKHTKLVWLRLPNSHCATKSLVTALQMSDVHFKSQTSTVQCFRFTEIVCTLLFSFYLWRQVEIKISKMIWLRQAARASKTSFLSADKKSNVHSIYSLFQIHNCAVEVNIQCAVN